MSNFQKRKTYYSNILISSLSQSLPTSVENLYLIVCMYSIYMFWKKIINYEQYKTNLESVTQCYWILSKNICTVLLTHFTICHSVSSCEWHMSYFLQGSRQNILFIQMLHTDTCSYISCILCFSVSVAAVFKKNKK